MWRKEFQRDNSVQFGVLGLIHDTHAPLSKFLQNLIMGYCLTDHCFIPYEFCAALWKHRAGTSSESIKNCISEHDDLANGTRFHLIPKLQA